MRDLRARTRLRAIGARAPSAAAAVRRGRVVPAVLVLCGALLAAALPACREKDGAQAEERKTPAVASDGARGAAEHPRVRAAPSARAGAGAGGTLCGEHGVLEAVCTKCNPRLVAVFQAKGDWCAEHGLPESVCPICHPERGGRPAVDVAPDRAPADGTKVRLRGKDTANWAGIETAKVASRSAGVEIVAPARIVYDAAKQAHVNARATGVVRAVHVDVGSRVKRGDKLLAIDSPEVGAGRSRLAAAEARVRAAEEGHAREQQALAEGVGSRKTVLETRRDLDEARADRAALAATLAALGTSGAAGGGGYVVGAPIAGVVVERRVSVGELVSGEQKLLEIVDTSRMWAEIDVPEVDLGAIALDQGARIALDVLDGRKVQGTIVYVAPEVDPRTRTAKARVPLQNPDGALRANLFGTARIEVGAARATVTVPRAAVQRVRDVHLVFVRLDDDLYEARRVKLGAAPPDAATVEVSKGLRAGEEVVTTGSFLLKTETLKDSIGAGCCDAD